MKNYIAFIRESQSPRSVVVLSSPCDLMRMTKAEWVSARRFNIAVNWVDENDGGMVKHGEGGTEYRIPPDACSRRSLLGSPILDAARHIVNWFRHGDPEQKSKVVETLISLASCPNRLPWTYEMSKPRVFRGIRRSVTDLRNARFSHMLFNAKKSSFVSVSNADPKNDLWMVAMVAYDPLHPVQSWSVDFSMAQQFSGAKPDVVWEKGSHQWILSFKPSKNEIVFGDIFCKEVSPYSSENEVVVKPKAGREVMVMLPMMRFFVAVENKVAKRYGEIFPNEERKARISALLGAENARTLMGMPQYLDYIEEANARFASGKG